MWLSKVRACRRAASRRRSAHEGKERKGVATRCSPSAGSRWNGRTSEMAAGVPVLRRAIGDGDRPYLGSVTCSSRCRRLPPATNVAGKWGQNSNASIERLPAAQRLGEVPQRADVRRLQLATVAREPAAQGLAGTARGKEQEELDEGENLRSSLRRREVESKSTSPWRQGIRIAGAAGGRTGSAQRLAGCAINCNRSSHDLFHGLNVVHG